LLFLFTHNIFAQTGLQRFISHPALKHASVGVSVVDMATGSPVVAYDADKSLTPASVLKLITTATALETLGDNYRYKTDIGLDAKDPSRILVIGSGDPTLASEAFEDNTNAFSSLWPKLFGKRCLMTVSILSMWWIICLDTTEYRRNGHGVIWGTITPQALMASAYSTTVTSCFSIRPTGIVVRRYCGQSRK